MKKICQDTKRHILETERMIEDVLSTSESISTSSTHKALVGGDKHTILEGQFFEGVGNHPQVPRYLRWNGKVRKRGITTTTTYNTITTTITTIITTITTITRMFVCQEAWKLKLTLFSFLLVFFVEKVYKRVNFGP